MTTSAVRCPELTDRLRRSEVTHGRDTTDESARHRIPRQARRGSGTVVARGVARPPGQLIVLVPAHNEAQGITETVTALLRQTYRPDRVVVVADNCRDDTAELAARAGAEIFTTNGNRHKKAGALNQVLADLLPRLAPDDFVMVVDADSVLDPDFLNHAVARLSADRRLGAVGGVFRGSDGSGFVGHLQRNEYARYARDVSRLNGKCLVVTGTAAVFRAGTLREVSAARLSGRLPAGDGAGAATSGSLALTGASTLWILLAGFAMVAAGAALMRIAPKLRRNR
ncbi:glycosyltransferase family 2 protein [Micromonospora sp. R77]|uniref:glycosyltransferase family 2 protein n=1 Tax=Micromonospora sp. R77 TaxID=2925836 RepID=UPI001F60B4DF|nr:glycosyltransferase family 2 protein [Micromonospora sp. R77]MCI4064526.1 glycosyltransferase family 2 protein [Micromonospora sp. R77]